MGLSAGGEWGGSTSYIVEYAPEGRRGFIGSWQQVSVGSGFLLGSLSAALLSSTLSPEAFISWGWRVPFLLGILVGILGAYLRWRLNDTPKFTEIKQHGEVAKARIGRKPLLLLSCGGYIILTYPLFMMAASGSATLALIAQMVMIVFCRSFPAHALRSIPKSSRPACATPPCQSATTSPWQCSAASRRSSRLG